MTMDGEKQFIHTSQNNIQIAVLVHSELTLVVINFGLSEVPALTWADDEIYIMWILVTMQMR